MTETFSRKDYLLLSAYLDGELSSSELKTVEKRLLIDSKFKQASEELAYTRRLLRAMPKIRAPHNFMLSPAQVKKTVRHQFFQPAWGLVSAVSTFLLLVIFAGTSIMSRPLAFRGAAPEMAPAANDAAMTQKAEGAIAEQPPMIILWNPQRAFGMGGGGGNDTGIIGGGDGSEPGSTTIMEVPQTPLPASPSASPTQTIAPEAPATEPLRQANPSTIILGIPDEKTQGTYTTSPAGTRVNLFAQFPPSAYLMAGLGLIALVSAALALLLRRR